MNEPSPPSSTASPSSSDWLQSLGTPLASQPTKVGAPASLPQMTPPTGDWLGSLGGAAPGNGTVVDEATARHIAETTKPQVPGYEIQGVLGRGGMGVVYLARHLALNRPVALKMILSGAHAAPQDLTRFRAEAEAVAKFTHPHIVQIFEVGVQDGVPYCALELLPGGSLEEQWRGQPQPPRQAATLMVPVAQAVQAAHDQGIIHRDLKPANILLTADGTPKLTDFGLAKRVAQDSGQTRTGDIVGTPSYMAPEQASGQVRQVGPAADVYALGAILYQLLTGRPPFLGLTTMDTVLQVLTTEAVPPKRLQPTVPDDLETICLKCLHKEPAKRYASAAALATDLQNYLDGKPILARPAGQWERTVKWCRRYPAVAALVAVVTLAAVGMGTLAAWAWQERDQKEEQRQQADVQRQKAVDARQEAVEQAELANAIKGFLQGDVLQLADPKTQYQDQVQGLKFDAEVKLRDVVLRASKTIEGKFTTQPLVEADLRATLALTLYGMGRVDLAVVHQERCRALYAKHRGADHTDTIRSMNNLADTYGALGRNDEAVQLHKEVQARLLAKYGPDHTATLRSKVNLGYVYACMGRHAEALQLYEEALTRQKQLLGLGHPDTLQCMLHQVKSHADMGQHDKAGKLLDEALPRMKTVLGPDHPSTLLGMMSLANHTAVMGRPAQAVPLHEATVAKMKAVFGPGHPNTLLGLDNLARLYSFLGRHREAVNLHEEAMTKRQAVLGPDHALTLGSKTDLAKGYATLGRHAEAVKLYEETLARKKAVLGPDHPDTLAMRNELALSHAALGQYKNALTLYQEARALREQRLARAPHDLDNLLNLGGLECNIGSALHRDAQFVESMAAYSQAIARQHAVLRQQPDTPTAKRFLRNAHLGRARVREEVRRYDDADEDWPRAIELSSAREKPVLAKERDQWKAKRQPPVSAKP